jgi:hypothetical protein
MQCISGNQSLLPVMQSPYRRKIPEKHYFVEICEYCGEKLGPSAGLMTEV